MFTAHAQLRIPKGVGVYAYPYRHNPRFLRVCIGSAVRLTLNRDEAHALAVVLTVVLDGQPRPDWATVQTTLPEANK